jgi:serine/threonine-protein kinase RsbW
VTDASPSGRPSRSDGTIGGTAEGATVTDDGLAEGAVTIEIPADRRFIGLTRVAAVSLAADLDVSIDEVEDLRISVDELVGHLIEAAAGRGQVRLELLLDESTVTVTGRCVPHAVVGEPDELTRRILESTADDYETGDGGFRLRKRLGLV